MRPIRSSGGTEGALEGAGRVEQHIITEAAQNELKLGEGASSDESGPSARRWRQGCSSGVVCENHLVGSELLSKRAHAQPPVEYPAGNPLDAKFLMEPIRSSGSTDDALEEAGQAEQHIITDAAPNEFKLGEGA